MKAEKQQTAVEWLVEHIENQTKNGIRITRNSKRKIK